MTKIEIVESLAEKTGMQKKDAESVLETLVNTIQESLKNGQKVNLAGLGTFVVVEKKARVARNPKTGEEIPISARRVVTFRAGHKLRARVEHYERLQNEKDTAE